MNSTIDLQREERTQRQERIHPGIFAFPALVFVFLLLPTLPLVSFLRMTGDMLRQMTPQGSPNTFSSMWLFLVALDLLPSIALFLVTLFAYMKSEVTLTNKRLIYSTGLLVRAAGELPLENVEATFIMEPLLGRFLGYGTVTVSTLGGLRLPLAYISKPHLFHAVLQRAVADAKAATHPTCKPRIPPQDDSRYMPKA